MFKKHHGLLTGPGLIELSGNRCPSVRKHSKECRLSFTDLPHLACLTCPMSQRSGGLGSRWTLDLSHPKIVGTAARTSYPLLPAILYPLPCTSLLLAASPHPTCCSYFHPLTLIFSLPLLLTLIFSTLLLPSALSVSLTMPSALTRLRNSSCSYTYSTDRLP